MYIIDDEKKYKYVTSGSEARIYRIDEDRAMKIFENPTYKFKTSKIDELSKLKLPGFIFPKEIVYKDNKKVGYAMEFLNDAVTLDSTLVELSLEKKIEYLKKIETLIKKAHEHNMFLVDMNLANFMIKNNEVIAIDTDNFTYNNYESEVIPRYASFYKKHFSNVIDSNIDKVVFTLLLLDVLVDENVYKLLGNDKRILSEYLNTVKLPKEILMIMKNNLSMEDKLYYNETLNHML